MTIEKFIEGFNKATNKEGYISKHINKKYVPYEEKVAKCIFIANASMYIDVDGEKIFKMNSPARYELFVLRMVDEYTDIDFDMVNDGTTVFNLLEENGLTGAVMQAIPELEYTSWSTLLKMTVDDIMENERNILKYIDVFKELAANIQ